LKILGDAMKIVFKYFTAVVLTLGSAYAQESEFKQVTENPILAQVRISLWAEGIQKEGKKASATELNSYINKLTQKVKK
jgi:hypothetical protein